MSEGPSNVRPARWLLVAFIARCARRYAELFIVDPYEPSGARTAIEEAVQLAERRAAIGGPQEFCDAMELDGKFFDHHDIKSLHEALQGYLIASDQTYDELSGEAGMEVIARRSLAAHRLACLALESAFPEGTNADGSPDLFSTVDWASNGDPQIQSYVERDLARMEHISNQEDWGDEAGAAAEIFGPLWDQGWPSEWPLPRLSFRPRARIIRTIGDRLVSGPEAAVIELVKNSYDADATTVRIVFTPPLEPGKGHISFEDDGHGMSLSDIQEKWMEPATSDKSQRRESPAGRQLLGSKGIGRFAVARLGQYLELVSVSHLASMRQPGACQKTRIAELDWNVFEETTYLDGVSFPVETSIVEGPPGTILKISNLRDVWTEVSVTRLHNELRRLVNPIEDGNDRPFKIILDLSRCTKENSGIDGKSFTRPSADQEDSSKLSCDPYEVRPYPMLDACDYAVEGAFDDMGAFEGTMTIRRAGLEPEAINLTVPLRDNEEPCGEIRVVLNIFDREAASIRSTAKKAGFGHLGVREARKLLNSIAGVTIYREGFRVRPYGDPENDWLTLDAKRVQNPSMKIGHNQVSGVITIADEQVSHLVERSSREGLEENGSFRRLHSLISALLAEVVEPRRRSFRLSSGLDKRKQSGFREVIGQADLSWVQPILEKLTAEDRLEAQELVSLESQRLISQLKYLDARQAQLEAQVTLGLIIGEVMHQGNTPLAFIETEAARLERWWPGLFGGTAEALEDRNEVPKILNGLKGSASSLRQLFTALNPLAGARRGEPRVYQVLGVIEETIYLFGSKAQDKGLNFIIDPDISSLFVKGYPEDLATALTNLIDNSIHWLGYHGITSPEVCFSLDEFQSGKVTIFIHDNGLGVEERFRDQLFDVGFTKKPNGTGLGLSIAREAIFRSAGDLYLVDSERGAKFAITLPLN